MDLGIFKVLVGSQTPKTASDLAEAVGADEVLLGMYAGAILIPLLTLQGRILRILGSHGAVREMPAGGYSANNISEAFALTENEWGMDFT
jgi:hypothetical protein